MKYYLSMAAVLAVLLLTTGARAEGTSASAELKNADGEVIGTATFAETESGVTIELEGEGLEPGPHGIHIHETGECDPPDFKSAGAHFNPAGAQHGLENPEGPHAGDLPNLEVEDDGTLDYEATTDRVTLGEGDNSLFDADGSALVIHADEDDQMTDPTGESGDRIACGTIVSAGMPEAGAGGTARHQQFPVEVAATLGALALGSGLLLRRRAARL